MKIKLKHYGRMVSILMVSLFLIGCATMADIGGGAMGGGAAGLVLSGGNPAGVPVGAALGATGVGIAKVAYSEIGRDDYSPLPIPDSPWSLLEKLFNVIGILGAIAIFLFITAPAFMIGLFVDRPGYGGVIKQMILRTKGAMA